MKHKMKKIGKPIAVLMTLAMILSLESGVIMPRKAQAADYGLKNPTTDSNGVTTWDCVYFGNYWQEDTNGDGVADENDEKQSIKWRVLSVDGDDAFLLADQNLDAKAYNTSYTDVTWETCTLRSWLNGYDASFNVENTNYSSNSDNFIDTAFTATEQSAILQTDVINEDKASYSKEENATTDQVYLLSVEDVSDVSYGFKSTFDVSSKTREAKNTSYAKKQGAWTSTSMECLENGYWWLRSPLGGGYYTSQVLDNGHVFFGLGYVNYDHVAVRPALHLNLSSSDLWSYGGTVSSEGGSQITNTPTPSGVSTGGGIRDLKNPVTDSNGVTTWDCIYFGNYYQSDATGTTKDPIKWRVLSVDGDDAFLLADQNLDARQYNKLRTDVTWENCTLRSWLNGYDASSNVEKTDYSSDNFIDTAFTAAEQNAIKQTNVVNEDNPEYGTEGGNDTMDQVYLLSIAEASSASYGFNSNYRTESKTRISTNTAYIVGKSGMNSVGVADLWWLRSSGSDSLDASYVGHSGYGYYYYYVDDNSVAVRPALHLNLSASDLWSYAGTVSAEGGSPTSVSETPVPSATPLADSTNSPTATMTGVTSASASPSVGPSETPDGTPSPDPTKAPTVTSTAKPTKKPVITPTAKPTRKPSSTSTAKPPQKPSSAPEVKPTKAPDSNVSAVPDSPVPAPSDAQTSSSQSPDGTQQPSGSPMPASTIHPGSTGTPSPSATAGSGVTVSASPLPLPMLTESPSVTTVTTQMLRKGQVFKDVKTKAYYKILSVTATGGKAAYLRPIDKKVKKVTIKETVTFKGKKFKVTQIGNKAFKDYKKLQKVTIGRKVSVIGKKTFANCRSLKVVILTGPKQKLPKNAFAGCPRKPKVRKTH